MREVHLNTGETLPSVVASTFPVGNLEDYIRRVREIPNLSCEEEFDLVSRLREQNDLGAATKLIVGHLKFVVKVAKGFAGYALPLADLIQEGNVGLMKAVKRFDHKLGVRLVSFAVHWIKSEISDYVIRNWRIVKVATTKAQRKLFFNLRKLTSRLGYLSPDEIKEIAKFLNVPSKDVIEMEQRLLGNQASLDLATEEGSSKTSHLLAKGEQDSNPALAYEETEEKLQVTKALGKALNKLESRTRFILQSRWLSDKKVTLKELAVSLGVSQERIRQLESSGMDFIRKDLASLD